MTFALSLCIRLSSDENYCHQVNFAASDNLLCSCHETLLEGITSPYSILLLQHFQSIQLKFLDRVNPNIYENQTIKLEKDNYIVISISNGIKNRQQPKWVQIVGTTVQHLFTIGHPKTTYQVLKPSGHPKTTYQKPSKKTNWPSKKTKYHTINKSIARAPMSNFKPSS